MVNKKVVLITGCSSGFGYFTALTFARNGWVVIASVRSIDVKARELKERSQSENLEIEVVQIDVTSDKQVSAEVQKVLRKYKKIDVLVNNAGFGYLGPIEDFEIDEVQEQYDVNVYGVLRTIKAVMPSMRERRTGTIINISSVNGLLSFGLYGIYSSSKFAIETISEALQFEVNPFNIKVCLIEPGGFATEFHNNGKLAQRYKNGNTAYSKLKNPLDDNSNGSLKNKSIIKKFIDPQRVADKIYEVANLTNPKMRYKIGLDTRIYTFVRSIVPQIVWDWMLHKAYKW